MCHIFFLILFFFFFFLIDAYFRSKPFLSVNTFCFYNLSKSLKVEIMSENGMKIFRFQIYWSHFAEHWVPSIDFSHYHIGNILGVWDPKEKPVWWVGRGKLTNEW